VFRRAAVILFVVSTLTVVGGHGAVATSGQMTATANLATTSGDGGASLTVTAGAPVAAAGTISQTLTQSFDPSRLQLTGSSGIVAPAGWTLTYSSDGSTFGAAPNTSSGWSAIRAVRATGSINSVGNADGLQIASGSATGSVPTSQAFASGGGGDGWDVAFDEQGNVYNTFHHDGYWGTGFKTPGVHCHTRTGAVCGPGWPFSLRIADGVVGPDGITGQPWYHTNEQSMQWVDTVNNRVWVPTNLNDGRPEKSGLGFACIDVSNLSVGPDWCGGDIRDAFVRLSPSMCGRDCALGLAVAGGRLFAWDSLTGKLLCMDPYATRTGNLPGAGCSGQPFSFPSISSVNLGHGYALMAANGLVWGAAGGASAARAICFDPEALTNCSGWSAGSVALSGTNPNMSFEVPAANGLAGAVCFTRYDSARGCFAPDGSSATELSGSHAGSALMTYVSGKVTTTITPKYAVTTGSRVYWSDGAWPGGGRIHCWDASLSSGTGATCPNWPVSVSAYTATIDAQNPNCIWTNTDSGAITQIDAITGAGTCTTPPPIAEFSAPVMLPRLACTNTASLQSWRNFTLTAPAASTYSTATLTVLTATGRVIPGWNRIAIPAGPRTVDLSGLSVAASGLSPRFRVILDDKTTNDAISAQVTAIGDSPQLCVPLQTVASCPSAPARIAGSIPAPSSIQIVGRGTAQPGAGPVEEFTSASASVQMTAPSDSTCLGSISGVTTMQGTSAVLPNAPVRILDANGTVVATTVSDANGNYSVDRLVAGSGYRVEFGPTSSGAANAATVASESTDRLVTANATTTVNGLYGVLRTNALSGSGGHDQPVSLSPAPHDSTNTQTYDAFTKSATCIVDPVDRVCKASVVVPSEGAWSVDPATGAIVFTPTPGFVGPSTTVTYRVTETSTSWTTTNTATVTIAAATTTTSPPSSQASAQSVSTTTTLAVSPRSVAIAPSAAARAASTGVVVSRVYVPSPGVIRQTGIASLGGSTSRVCSSRPRTVTDQGTFTSSCKLTKSAMSMVKTDKVVVVLITRFVGNDGTKRVTRTRVVLRRSPTLPATR
jgi:CshA-type fibril repeat protein